jgi:arsenate reductase (glutaredoxin)
VSIANELGIEPEIIVYQKTPPDRAALTWLVEHLEDPVADLVRKDSQFAKLGLSAEDYTSPEAVVELLLKHKMLMQRPVVVRGDQAIIGRPKERIRQLLT